MKPKLPAMPLDRRTLWIGVGATGGRIAAEARRRAHERWSVPSGAAFVDASGGGALDVVLAQALARLARPPQPRPLERGARQPANMVGAANGWSQSGDGTPPEVAAIVVAGWSVGPATRRLGPLSAAIRAAVAARLSAATSVTAVLLVPERRRAAETARRSATAEPSPTGRSSGRANSADVEVDGGTIVLTAVTAAGWRFPSPAERIAGAAELLLCLALLGPDRWPDDDNAVPDSVRTAGLATAVLSVDAAADRAARTIATHAIERLLGPAAPPADGAGSPWSDLSHELPSAARLRDALIGPLLAPSPVDADPHRAVREALARLAWAVDQEATLRTHAALLLRRWEERLAETRRGALARLDDDGLSGIARGLDGLANACAAHGATATAAAAAARRTIATLDADLESQAAALTAHAPAPPTAPGAGWRAVLRRVLRLRADARARAHVAATALRVTRLLDAKHDAVLDHVAQEGTARACATAAESTRLEHQRASELIVALMSADAALGTAAADIGDAAQLPCFELSLTIDDLGEVGAAPDALALGVDLAVTASDALAGWWDAPPSGAVLAAFLRDAARAATEQRVRVADDGASVVSAMPAAADLVAAVAALRRHAVPWLTWDATALSNADRAPIAVRWVLAVAGGAESALWRARPHDDWHDVLDNGDPSRITVLVAVHGLVASMVEAMP
ncbi:MAG: hypothetical protein ABI780_05580 [Ardenticatenales bacterium]